MIRGEGAETFMVLDIDSGNVVAYFDEPGPAESVLYQVAEQDRARADALALVACDKGGFASQTILGSDYS